MPKVSSPGELGIGRGAGKLGALDLPRRRATATPETFGAGVRHFDQPVVGGQTYVPRYQPAKSGFELLADTVAHIASVGSQTAEKVNDANNAAALTQMKLQASTAWTEQNLAREAAIEKGANPGDDYAKKALADFDSWSAKQLEGLGGVQKVEMEQHFGQLKLHTMEEATGFQATRKREHRELQNKISAGAIEEGVASAQNVVFNNPSLLGTHLQDIHDKIDALQVADDVKAEMRRDATGALSAAMWTRKVQDDPYGARDMLTSGDPATLAGLEYDDRLRALSHADTKINGLETEARQRASEARAEQRQAAAEAKTNQRMDSLFLADQVTNARGVLDSGLSLQPEAVRTLAEQTLTLAKTAIDPDTRRRAQMSHEALQAAVETQDFSKVFANMPVEQQVEEIRRRRATPIDPDDAAAIGELQKASKILGETEEAVRENRVLARANQLGVVATQQVDLTNPEQIAARVREAHKAAEHFRTNVEMFYPDERARYAAIIAAMPGEQKASYLASVQAAAGEDYPQVIRELGLKGGLDRDARYIAILPPGSPIVNAVGEAMDTDPKDLKVNLDRRKPTGSNFDRDVINRLTKWMDTVGPAYTQGGVRTSEHITDVTDMVKNTAMKLMQTHNYDEAIDLAANGIINDRYDWGDGYRTPKLRTGGTAYTARLEKMMADTMTALTPELVEPMGSPAGVDERTRRFGYLEAVRTRGRWANLPDDSGLMLLDEAGNTVLAAGRPVIVKF